MTTNPVSLIHTIHDGDARYKALLLWCPGCEYDAEDGGKVGGLHMLPVHNSSKPISQERPTWEWNGDLVTVTLSPSILTRTKRKDADFVCHSFLRNAMWEFLGDCTHSLANRHAPMVPLPDWVVR